MWLISTQPIRNLRYIWQKRRGARVNLLLSSYKIFWNRCNPVNHQLYNNLLDQFLFFRCYHTSLVHFFCLAKNILSIDYNIVIFNFYSWKKFHLQLIRCWLFSNDKTKSLFFPWNSNQLINNNIGLRLVSLLLIDFIPISCSFKTGF